MKTSEPRRDMVRLRRAALITNVVAWAVASGLLSASTITGGFLLVEHGFHPAAAWTMALSVDCGVAVGLYGGQVLASYGLGCGWATALRWVCAVASLILNVLGPVLRGDIYGAGLHALAPLILVVALEAATAISKQLGLLHIRLSAVAPDQVRATAPRWSAGPQSEDQPHPSSPEPVATPKDAQPVGDHANAAPQPVDRLLSAARTIAADLESQGRQLSRRSLVAGLRDAGFRCSTDRANELLALIRAEQTTRSVAEDHVRTPALAGA